MAGTDRVARVLHTLRMRSTFYCHAELGEPWALEMPAIADSLSFHVLTGGQCWLRLGTADPRELRTGHLALVPHGKGHELLSAPTVPGDTGPARVDQLEQHYLTDQFSVLQHGGSGRGAQLICGVVTFEDPAARQLMRSLPELLIIDDGDTAASAIRDTLRLMAIELARPQPGGEVIATRCADILVVQAIRAWLATGATSGWLHALEDERIGGALEALHDDPGHPWSLASLARAATMSRSAFSARFTDLVGQSPIAYLTRWRMQLAESRLRSDGATAARVASELGYRSEAAFHRAFTRVIGCTPGSVRDQG